jgi:hypothetical protein
MWRFGQKQDVTVDIISTEGQRRVFENLKRKTAAADLMFEKIVGLMKNELRIDRVNQYTKEEKFPSWL